MSTPPGSPPPERLRPGRAAPLGAHVVDGGVQFAVFSQHAERIELCLFDDAGTRELARHALPPAGDGVFSGVLPGARPGLVYGYRAHGDWKPGAGHRFNPHKLLLDPWAREIVGRFEWRPEHFAHAHGDGACVPDPRDNAAFALKARVTPPAPAARPARHPRLPLSQVVLYELHVKGFTMTLPGMPEALRGTYAGLAHPAAIAHLRRLGVTTLSLLPVHAAIDEQALGERGLGNYWGYNTIGFFCPDARFSASRRSGDDGPGAVAAEFRAMVAALQAAGFEVVLDVVFNHTAEAGEHGPSISFRGLDNASWYRLQAGGRHEDSSGCGNTLRVAHPRVAQFVLDALRYWVEAMGVDGFRFDLAPALGRTHQGFDPAAPFWVALCQDPMLSQVHLIAEPWDLGHDGYQLGRMPGRFAEWNDRFRDDARGYWLGDDAHHRAATGRSVFARRFTASSDCFHHDRRLPIASVNFVAAHDGRTLADVVAYRDRHNLANGEHGRDGHPHEVCANFGVEGPSDDPRIAGARRRVRRALLATTLLAQGTPMLCAGDEFGNSQHGNNNAYCQDNATGWLDWGRAGGDDDIDFVASLIALRREDPLLRHPHWFAAAPGAREPALHWLRPDGEAMRIEDWHDPQARAFACQLAVDAASPPRWCVVFNPGAQPARFRLPRGPWRLAADSSGTLAMPGPSARGEDPVLEVPFRSLLLLRHDDYPQETHR